MPNLIEIPDIVAFEGTIPPYYDLIVYEKGDVDTAMTLLGFDEIGEFDEQFTSPCYGLLQFFNPDDPDQPGDFDD